MGEREERSMKGGRYVQESQAGGREGKGGGGEANSKW